MAEVELGPLRRRLRNSTPAADPVGPGGGIIPLTGRARRILTATGLRAVPAPADAHNPAAVPRTGSAPSAVTVAVPESQPRRTVRASDLVPMDETDDNGDAPRLGRHKWRPGEPLEWRPAALNHTED